MQRFKHALMALALGSALVTAPGAWADSYHYGDRYYFGDDHGRFEHRHDRYRHDRYERRWHEGRHYKPGRGHGYGRGPHRVIEHNVYHHAPPRRHVIVRDYHHRGGDRYDYGYESATPLILGGLIGGVLGNQVGKGRGRDAATVAGAVLGGSIGRDISRRR